MLAQRTLGSGSGFLKSKGGETIRLPPNPPKMGTSGIPATFRRPPGPRAEPEDWGGAAPKMHRGVPRSSPSGQRITPGFWSCSLRRLPEGVQVWGGGRERGRSPLRQGVVSVRFWGGHCRNQERFFFVKKGRVGSSQPMPVFRPGTSPPTVSLPNRLCRV